MPDTISDKTSKNGKAYGYPWIKAIHINKIRHLNDIDIPVCDETASRHLLITGPNGSGKTSLLLAIEKLLETKANGNAYRELEDSCELELDIHEYSALPKLFKDNSFIVAYYNDRRISTFKDVKTPEKPNVKFNIDDNNGDQFLKFLVDLKIQQALAKNEQNDSDANEIGKWFDEFVAVLQKLFDDRDLKLEFNYRDYSFNILTGGTKFPFTGLSAGYAAALDIVADLILRMQNLNNLKRVFDMPGIALVDEIETHLHLSLQQKIMPILTSLFPKVQFIVSTHSPFVLNSISDATVYDLKNRQCIQNLTEYSYDALAEGYFGVETDSGELKRRLDRLESLIGTNGLTVAEQSTLKDLLQDFDKMPDWVAPMQKARFYELKRQYILNGGSL